MGFAVGGVGFALAQLLFARALDPADFAVVSLVLAMNQIGFAAASLGIEVPINRHRIPASRILLGRTIIGALPVAFAVGLTGWLLYHLDFAAASLLSAIIVASTAGTVASALFRSTQQFVAGLLLTQLQNYALLLIAGIALAMTSASATIVIAMMLCSYGIGAVIGWLAALKRDAGAPHQGPTAAQVREGFLAFGYTVAVMVLVQFERLIIPGRLAMADLAVFSVAAALVASPFRMLQIGVGFTLLPRLRSCHSLAEIRRILWREGVVIVGAMMILIVAVWLLTPFILNAFLRGRYQVSNSLLIAMFVVGVIRVGSAFATSSVQALGESTDFRQMTLYAWLCIALGGTCALLGAQFGIHGIVYGVGVGWLALTCFAILVARRAGRRWVDRGHAATLAKSADPQLRTNESP